MEQRFQRSSALRAGLFAGAALLLMGGQAVAEGADAAAAGAVAADGSVGLEEVVVTAQKRATNLQDTPIAIAAMGSEDLARRHIQSLADLSDGAIPSLRIEPMFSRSSALTIGIRGIGAQGDANQPARDQAVGVYLDGVYLGRAQGLGSALYDVEQIEVLRGPQGTLFGRNTEGGAISIVTRKPSGEFGVDTVVGYGNYNSYKAALHVNLPEFHDVSLKFDGLLLKRDGTVKNPAPGQQDFNAFDKKGFQAQALWKPRDDFNAEYAFDYSYDGTTPFYVQLLNKGMLPLAPIAPLQPERATSAQVGVPLQLSVGETWGHRINLNWQLSDALAVKSISSYRKLDQSQYDNGMVALSAFAPNAPFARYSLAHTWQDQYSQEIQLIGKIPRLEYVGGVFYYHEKVHDNAQTPNTLQWNANGTGYTTLSVNLDTYPFDRASHVTTESYGVFGQAVWTPPILDDKARLTLGGRMTHDAKDGALDTVNGAIPSYVDANKVTHTGAIPLDASWNHFDPLVVLAYDVNSDVNLYGKWSTGYKAGGANSRSLTFRPFDPEVLRMFEVGAKTEFWDHRARLNIAAYKGKLKDAQIDFQVLVVNNNRGTLETTNAATGTTKGVEIDASLNPVEGLTLSASYAYTDIKLSQAFNPFTNSLATIYPVNTPKNAGSVAVDYEHPAFGATLLAHLDGNYSDGQFSTSTDPTLSDSYFVVNGRLALSDIRVANGANMQVSLWARNLFDESHVFARSFNATLGTYGIFNEPRTFGVEARLQY